MTTSERVNRKIYILETPPHMQPFQQVVWIASQEEVAAMKREAPYLTIREPNPDEHAVLQGDAHVDGFPQAELPDIELTEQQKHILEVLSTPMSLHAFGKKKVELKEAEEEK